MARLKPATLLPAMLLLAAVASCGQAEGQRLEGAAAATRQSSITASEYARRAGTADLFEIESGQLALRKSDREDIRALARMIVDDHTRAAETLEEATSETMGSAAQPARLDTAHQAKLRQLQAAEGPAFDQLYLDMQRQGHEEALALHRGYAAGGDNTALKVVAGELATMVGKHLQEVERISGTHSAPPPRG